MTAEYFERLWQAVTTGDEYAAGQAVVQALGAGLDAETVLLDMVGAVQRKVGHEWAANRLTVAQEHAATAINDRVLAGFGSVLPEPRAHRGRIAVACVDGEWHAMPARLLAEVLKVRGFRVDYLGAQVPAPRLVAHLHRTGPDAVALSASLATRLPAAHATITACRAAATPVIVGGAAFGPDGRYARLLGADAWAPEARAAADLLSSPLPRPRAGHQPLDDLPHLADQEYTLVSSTSSALVKAILAGLEDRVPAIREYTSRQRQHTAEDLAHIVEYLAVSLYVGDGELFTEFLSWTAEILSARRVPAGSLLPALDLLRAELHDFPRSQAMIDAARVRVSNALSS